MLEHHDVYNIQCIIYNVYSHIWVDGSEFCRRGKGSKAFEL